METEFDVGLEVLIRRHPGDHRYHLEDRMIIVRRFTAGRSWFYMVRDKDGQMLFFAHEELVNPCEELVYTFDQEKKNGK